MTYPRVEIHGINLPEPFDGIDSREYSNGNEAVYYPSNWTIVSDIGMVLIEWEAETLKRQWISLNNVDSINEYHEG